MSAVRESVYPAYRQQGGLKGALLLTDVKTDKVISITLWETEADLMAFEITSRQQRDKLGDLFDLGARDATVTLLSITTREGKETERWLLSNRDHQYSQVSWRQILRCRP